ncbi:serine hydrolase [Paenibacillus sp. R14(2021)]|uniref:serine hydrolase n=1 Tax=Paenibacillus sp. R14(2021) TaxID=2859228 RepID=UPI001C6119D6|nr:serine hydrolase [Paenibacillus sp. R14(2021)]
MTGKLIQALTGSTIADLLTAKVLDPLQCSATEWVSVPKASLVCVFQADGSYASVRIESNEGHERNLYTSSLDLARWGMLHLGKGIINGNRLLPPELFDLYDELLTSEEAGKRLFGCIIRTIGIMRPEPPAATASYYQRITPSAFACSTATPTTTRRIRLRLTIPCCKP